MPPENMSLLHTIVYYMQMILTAVAVCIGVALGRLMSNEIISYGKSYLDAYVRFIINKLLRDCFSNKRSNLALWISELNSKCRGEIIRSIVFSTLYVVYKLCIAALNVRAFTLSLFKSVFYGLIRVSDIIATIFLIIIRSIVFSTSYIVYKLCVAALNIRAFAFSLFRGGFYNSIRVAAIIVTMLLIGSPSRVLTFDLSEFARNTDYSHINPNMKVISLVSYGMGTVLVVAGMSNAKKHADQPSLTPLGPSIGRLGAGAAFLAAPTVIGMLKETGRNTVAVGQSTFQSIGF